MNEKLIERKLREGVKARGGLAIKFFAPSFTGLPDRIVLMPGGKIHFVEVKTTGSGLSKRQKIVVGQLREFGFDVWIISDQELLDLFFNRITQ